MSLPLITVSQMRMFNRCHHEHHLAYELGYRPIEDAATLSFGRLIHTGLEAWMKATRAWQRQFETVSASVPSQALDDALLALAAASTADLDTFTLVNAEELLRGYHFRWEDEPFEVLEVERQFATPVINPESGAPSRTYELGGKVDGIVRRRDGVYLIEHKTAGEDIGLGSVYWECLRLDSQISVYFEGAKSLGHEVIGCLYDVIRKPGIRPSATPLVDEAGVKIVLDATGSRVRTKDGKKWRETGSTVDGYVLQTRPETSEEWRARLRADIAENPDRYYQRGTVVRLERELRDAAADVWQTARNMREGELAARHPRNTGSCRRYSRLCSYFAACTGAASLDDTSLYRRVDNVHQELSIASTD